MKAAKVRLGRYGESLWIEFLRSFSGIQSETRKRTASELAEAEIRASIREDLRPGVKPHESGNDVKSIALAEIEELFGPIRKERDAQEKASLKATLALLDDVRANVQKRLLELGGPQVTEQGRRALEIAEARARREEREKKAL